LLGYQWFANICRTKRCVSNPRYLSERPPLCTLQSASIRQILTLRAVDNGGVFNIIIKQPSAECGGVCDFAIALFEVFIFRIIPQSVFPCLGLNDVGPDTAHFFVLRQDIRHVGRIPSLEKDSQGHAVFDSLVSALSKMRKHRMDSVTQ
jgi:hypothetical protein